MFCFLVHFSPWRFSDEAFSEEGRLSLLYCLEYGTKTCPKIILIMSLCLASGIYSLVFSISQLACHCPHGPSCRLVPGTRTSGRKRNPGFKPVANQSIWKSLWYLRCGNTLGNVWSCFWGCRRSSGFFILKKALLWETKNCYQSIEQVPFGSFQQHYPDIFFLY